MCVVSIMAGSYKALHALDIQEKLSLKVEWNGDIRRMPLNDEEIKLKELTTLLTDTFKLQLKSSDCVLIKYRDSENDLITIANDSDLEYAKIVSGKLLKVVLFVNKGSLQSKGNLVHVQSTVQQCLKELNDKVEALTRMVMNLTPPEEEDSTQLIANVDPEVRSSFDPLSGGETTKDPKKRFSDASQYSSEASQSNPSSVQPASVQPAGYAAASTTNDVQQAPQRSHPQIQPAPMYAGQNASSDVNQKAASYQQQQSGMTATPAQGVPQQQGQSYAMQPQQQYQQQTGYSQQQANPAAVTPQQQAYGMYSQAQYGYQQQQQQQPQQPRQYY